MATPSRYGFSDSVVDEMKSQELRSQSNLNNSIANFSSAVINAGAKIFQVNQMLQDTADKSNAKNIYTSNFTEDKMYAGFKTNGKVDFDLISQTRLEVDDIVESGKYTDIYGQEQILTKGEQKYLKEYIRNGRANYDKAYDSLNAQLNIKDTLTNLKNDTILTYDTLDKESVNQYGATLEDLNNARKQKEYEYLSGVNTQNELFTTMGDMVNNKPYGNLRFPYNDKNSIEDMLKYRMNSITNQSAKDFCSIAYTGKNDKAIADTNFFAWEEKIFDEYNKEKQSAGFGEITENEKEEIRLFQKKAKDKWLNEQMIGQRYIQENLRTSLDKVNGVSLMGSAILIDNKPIEEYINNEIAKAKVTDNRIIQSISKQVFDDSLLKLCATGQMTDTYLNSLPYGSSPITDSLKIAKEQNIPYGAVKELIDVVGSTSGQTIRKYIDFCQNDVLQGTPKDELLTKINTDNSLSYEQKTNLVEYMNNLYKNLGIDSKDNDILSQLKTLTGNPTTKDKKGNDTIINTDYQRKSAILFDLLRMNNYGDLHSEYSMKKLKEDFDYINNQKNFKALQDSNWIRDLNRENKIKNKNIQFLLTGTEANSFSKLMENVIEQRADQNNYNLHENIDKVQVGTFDEVQRNSMAKGLYGVNYNELNDYNKNCIMNYIMKKAYKVGMTEKVKEMTGRKDLQGNFTTQHIGEYDLECLTLGTDIDGNRISMCLLPNSQHSNLSSYCLFNEGTKEVRPLEIIGRSSKEFEERESGGAGRAFMPAIYNIFLSHYKNKENIFTTQLESAVRFWDTRLVK